MLSAIMLGVVMLSVVILSVIILGVVAQFEQVDDKTKQKIEVEVLKKKLNYLPPAWLFK